MSVSGASTNSSQPFSALPFRTAYEERPTKETFVQVALSLDGGPLPPLPDTAAYVAASHRTNPDRPIPKQTAETHASQFSGRQTIWAWTGVGFLDHMLHALAKHAGWSLRVRTVGDLLIDDHHTTEDTFLALGAAFSAALGPRAGIKRFGSAFAPLDEALARAVIDISSRPFFDGVFGFDNERIGDLTTQMIPHCLQSFSQTAKVTLHVDVLKGKNDHHRAEAAFKALAVACREACERVKGWEGEIASTKGVLES